MLNNNPRISVLMSVWNCEKHLMPSIDSILRQTFDEFELIIVDDGCSDSTPQLLDSIQDARVRIIHQQNTGLTIALNTAAAMARAEYLARIDAGDTCHKQRFEKQIQFLDNNPEVACLGTAAIMVDENQHEIGKSNVITNPEAVKNGLLKMNLLAHGSVMMRKSSFDEVGGYRSAFKYAQDYDLWLRISEKFKISNLAEHLYQWAIDEQSISISKYAIQQQYRAHALKSAKARRNGDVDPVEAFEHLEIEVSKLSENQVKAVFEKNLAKANIMGNNFVAARIHFWNSYRFNPDFTSIMLWLFSCQHPAVIKLISKLRLQWLNKN
jgi:O-antigen biosynthesis protein